MKKIVLIDGNSILNRAFYGLPALSNAKGFPTNAVLGFLNILFRILEEEKPAFLAVAFDVHAPTFRHKIYKEYKGTRKPMPEELREQVPVMKKVLAAMGICMVEQPGLEADDILGTLARRAEADGMCVTLLSGDRDLLQIATGQIKIRIPKTKGGKTEIEDYYAKDVLEKYQVTPEQFIDVKALMGDPSDNIPGVPRIGGKTATGLIVQFGSLEGVYQGLDQVAGKAVRESLAAHKDLADLSKVLAAIKIEEEFPFSYEEAKIGDFYTKEAYLLLKELEFKNFLGRFGEEVISDRKGGEKRPSFCKVTDLAKAEEIFAGPMESVIGVCLFEDGEKEADFVGMSLALSEETVYYFSGQGFLTRRYLAGQLQNLAGKVTISTFDIKKKYDFFLDSAQVAARGLGATKDFFDILIAAYLLNPLKNDYEIEDIGNQYLNQVIESRTRLFGKASFQEAAEQQEERLMNYACHLAEICRQGAGVLERQLQEAGMKDLMEKIEMPLSYVLHDMEKIGVQVQRTELKRYGEALHGRICELEQLIYEQAGAEFNINSPKQLGEILFGRLSLPGGKKTKTGYSTAADVLEKLEGDFPIVKDILEYRGLAKLKSTYAEGLAAYIGEDGRIHTNFKQTITATGRLSSTEPNLQNIPMRMELGRLIRKVFVPAPGRLFMDADYSQIELRILAHLSGDEQLIEAYRMDEDIHRITAAQVFHVPLEEVTDLQRRNAKAVNFGIVYGISSFGLSQGLSISRKEAESYIGQYFATYPAVKQLLERTVAAAKRQGYITTMFGRRRPVPELASSNFMQRSFGERVAMNSPIQGTAADIMKIAMIRVWDRLKKEKLESQLVLQIHDELLLEVTEREQEAAQRILTEEMRGAAELAVTLEIDLHTGTNWYETK